MYTKRHFVWFIILAIVIGIIIGAQSEKNKKILNTGMHQMPDGTFMTESGDDMASMMADMNASLEGKTGDGFDRAFIEEMTVHHQGAIEMAKLALANAKHQEIKELANAIVTAQTKEINQMAQWKASWYKSN